LSPEISANPPHLPQKILHGVVFREVGNIGGEE